jgi:hypothetical protein
MKWCMNDLVGAIVVGSKDKKKSFYGKVNSVLAIASLVVRKLESMYSIGNNLSF